MNFDTETIIYIIIESIIGFASIVGNTIVCYVILRNRTFRKTPMYIFVTSLAVADIFVGLIVAPFGILTKLGLPYNNPLLCIGMITFIIIPTLVSIYSLTAVSIERYLAIRFPIMHLSKVNSKTSCVLVGSIWLLSFCIGLLPVFGWNTIDWSQWIDESSSIIANQNNATNNFRVNTTTFIASIRQECQFVQVVDADYLFFTFLVCGLIPLSICGVMYLLIYLHVLKIKKRYRRTKISSTTSKKKRVKTMETLSQDHTSETRTSSTNMSTSFTLTPTEKVKHDNERKYRQQKKKEIRIATVLGLTVLAFAVCWLPLHILNTIVRFSPVFVPIPLWVFSLAILLSHANSAVNIFLYSWRIEPFQKELKRKVIKKLFFCC